MKNCDTIYVTVGRRSGKTMIQARQIEELMKSGKKVILVEPKCTSRHVNSQTYANGIVDLDILDPERMKRAEEILNMFLKGE